MVRFEQGQARGYRASRLFIDLGASHFPTVIIPEPAAQVDI
jgi:hypothetical protein